MTNKFLSGLQDATNVAYTANGARAYATTNSSVLDFFSQGGALRARTTQDKIALFTKAFAEDKLLALKALFYFRDVRGGQGERQTFRDILRYLANSQPEVIAKNIDLIPYFGRWDDLYELDGTKLEDLAYATLRAKFIEDLSSKNPSLLGKWLKSENASSPRTRKLGAKTRKAFGLTPRIYRKALSDLRERISIVETDLTEKNYDAIDYSKLPSQAGLRYRQAFYRNDAERYTSFIDAAKKGVDVNGKEVKINTKTLYPYEIVSKILDGGMRYYGNKYYASVGNVADMEALDAMWVNLPDYFDGAEENSICVVDTSGSMSGQPMNIAVSLGIYTAERNKGAFKDHFITFSENPKLQKIQGSNIVEKVTNLARADWQMSTNIEKVFDLILNTAVKEGLSQDELPQRIYIISDMQFNAAVKGGNNEALFKNLAKRFASNGYTMPALVFWNVNAFANNAPMTMNELGVQLVSGASPSIFTNLLKNKLATAYEMMLDVLNQERYNLVQV
jgi:hypothetical protein